MDDLQRNANKAIVSHAFFRLESALTIALTILLAFFLPSPLPGWQWWYWVVLGGIAEALIVYTSITDVRTAQWVLAAMVREQFDPKEIKTPKYRAKVEQALEYRDKIQAVIASTPTSILRTHLRESTSGVADWIAHIFTLALRLDTYERDQVLRRDLRELPASIDSLRKAADTTKNLETRQQIDLTLAAKKAQHENLLTLQSRMQQAELSLEQTLAALGSVYSQFQTIRAQKISGSGAKNLASNIHDQAQNLEDIIQAMDQVYGRS
ncbi:MAG: hypothetical protein GX552_08545 [Chloroflexi bacterium]|jgi:hypothetical protein|nr:hypothetical protein [Chloroflexota bacterium]